MTAGAGRVVRLGHLLLQVGDLEAAERFYVGFLGLSVRKRERFRDGRPLVVTEQGIGLTDGRPAGVAGLGAVEHVALGVDAVAPFAERAVAEGVRVLRGPEPSAYGTSLYLADPDGNQVELFGPDRDRVAP